ncbi:MAG: hypothetical protein WAT93_00110 [Pontixanthobacter sp.]
MSSVATSAYDPVILAKGWERVDFASAEGCEAEIGTNGQFYVIAVYGMRPDEAGSFYLTNEDIKPINRRIRANQQGNWSEYYVPYLWGRSGGLVNINIASESCALNLSFEWKLQGIKMHG